LKTDAAVFHRSSHLSEDMLEQPNLACSFCGSTDRKKILVLQDGPLVYLVECLTCKAVSASRMPTNHSLEEYYAEYYQSPLFVDASQKVTFDGVGRFGKHMAEGFTKCEIKKEISILDFGGGDGSISYQVAKELLSEGGNFVNITVVDYDNGAVNSDCNAISIKKLSELNDVEGRHDFVIASAILEHVPYPEEIIGLLLGKTGGRHLYTCSICYSFDPSAR